MSKLKWHIIVFALWLAFSGVAAAEQLYVNESGWWRDGGAFNVDGAPIQAAVDAAGAGDSIYVWNGSYSENIYISVASLILQGEGADVVTVTAASSMGHVFYVAANWVNISGFTVTGATGSTKAGICLYSADHCNIYNNNASNNKNGIYLSCSSNNTLTKNTISGNTYDFGVSGSDLSHYIQNIDTSNTVGGKPIYYWVGQKDKQIPGDAGFVGVVNSTNITVRDIFLTNNRQGVLFTHTENSKMENVTTSNNEYGIYLSSSSNYNTLTKNTANSNNENGIGLSYSSNNTLMKNTANSNIGDGIHISSYLYSSTNNTLTNNNCSNNRYGIYLFNTNNNNITCNLVQNNMYQGFYLGLVKN
ncbi:MAG: NosD domain-containing protein [Euryarchaeota archaeon]|nr:NosD domain-containing protein [Euryarchaeota archaeon]